MNKLLPTIRSPLLAIDCVLALRESNAASVRPSLISLRYRRAPLAAVCGSSFAYVQLAGARSASQCRGLEAPQALVGCDGGEVRQRALCC